MDENVLDTPLTIAVKTISNSAMDATIKLCPHIGTESYEVINVVPDKEAVQILTENDSSGIEVLPEDDRDGNDPNATNLITCTNGSQWSYISFGHDGLIKLTAQKCPGDSDTDLVSEVNQTNPDDLIFVEDNQQEIPSDTPAQVIFINNGQLAFFQPKDGYKTIKIDNCTTLFTVADEGEVKNVVANRVGTPPEEESEGGVEEAGPTVLKKRAKNHVCSEPGCNRAYTSLHHLKVHIRNHTGVRPYACTIDGCTKAFATDYSRKAHIRTHTGEKPFPCPSESCSKAFKTSGDLQKHIRTHTGERPFMCPVEGCRRSFTTSNIRKVHMRTHTGERPYTCSEPGCERTFASSTNYKNHLRIHSGEKPYACAVANCDKRFTEYSSLYKHQLVHSQHRRHRCHFCERTYRQAATLNTHKRVVHGIITTEDGTEIVLEQMIGIGADGNKNFKNITNNLLSLKREGALIAVNGSEELFILSQGNQANELDFGENEDDNL